MSEKSQFTPTLLYKTPREKSEFYWGWLFILPTVIGLIVLNIYPIFSTIYQSFFKSGDFGLGNIYVGLENYKRLFQDRDVLQAILNSLLYMVLEVPVSVFISLLLAVALNKKIAFQSGYRAIFFLPMVVAPAAVAMVWRWLLNTEYGLVNNVFGIKVNWLSNPDIALISLAVIGIWSILGYNIVILLSGLQEVPKDYYEAAEIDGVGKWGQLWYITVPLISPTLYFIFMTRIIAALQIFDIIFMVIDRSNPALFRTQSLVYLFYRESFVYQNKGYGAAIVVVLLIITLILTLVQNAMQKRWVHYE